MTEVLTDTIAYDGHQLFDWLTFIDTHSLGAIVKQTNLELSHFIFKFDNILGKLSTIKTISTQ